MTRTIQRGDIYYIKGTTATGSEQSGNRPAIIVSNDTGNKHAPVVEVVYLTTKQKTDLPTHVYIASAERPSIALCEQIVTVCKSRLSRYIGAATETEMRRVEKALSTSLGIKEAGGTTMKINLKTDYGEMNLDMPQDKVLDLIQKATAYAAGAQGTTDTTQEAPSEPQAATETSQPRYLPHRRVDSLFGNFRAQKKTQPEKYEAEEYTESEEYSGFLLLKCERCGKLKGFCAKRPISEYTCECGGRTELHGLKIAHLHCKCGSHFKYKTNITAETFEYPCLNCGSPVDLELNNRRNTYVTITD